jgi:lipid-binding SYLF domain-containing protein
MKPALRATLFILLLFLPFASTWADEYAETKKMFVDGGASNMFSSAYGYALFPTIGKAGFVIGGAYGKGRVYAQGKAGFVIGGAYGKGRVYAQGKNIGNTSMTQATIGFQLGGSGFSQVIFFEDKRALDQFTSGNFEFGAEAQAVILTAAAGASANTSGSSVGASGGKNNATTKGSYHKGMATFTITKGGLMYEASVGGQKFSYTPR